MRVQDIMERKFAMLELDDGLDHMLEVFSKKGITSAPVFSKGELVGVVCYNDFARFFAPKDVMSLPFMENGQRSEERMIASSLARKPQFTLSPDQPVSLALSRIVSTHDCIPVMSGRKVVGVVRPERVIDFFLAERAKKDATEHRKAPPGKKTKVQLEEENATAIDRMLGIVKRDGETTPKKVARELGITESTSEDLARLLDKHSLVEVSYSFLSGMTIRRIGHGD